MAQNQPDLKSSRSAQIAPSHPLDPLTSDEIAAVTLTLRKYVVEKTDIKAICFITCYLLPPPKRVVLAALGIPIALGKKPESPIPFVRKAEVDGEKFLDEAAGCSYNAVLSFQNTSWVVDELERLSGSLHAQITPEELCDAESVICADARVQKLAADIGVRPDQLCADGWAMGYDDRFPQSRRVQQGVMFARFGAHENLYAHPLDFVPVVDTHTREVLYIDFPPKYVPSASGRPTLSSGTTEPSPLKEDSLEFSKRERIPPPLTQFDFLLDLLRKNPGWKEREGLKPLHIIQPEGVSFTMDGHMLEWQNWRMHVAFNHREGIALSTITYTDNGEVRPIFYRLSLVEMVVPYAAPEFPHPRKFAFDVGEYGMGTTANELSLGCDCVGQIHYLPGAYVTHDGGVAVIKNAICIHEEDAGVLWKHQDFRPGGRGRTVRSRRLVISMICTVANYEYICNYHFYQDGSIEVEIRLTGVLQVYVADENEPNPFGSTIAPRINAHIHQHLFSIRADAMIDGLNNTVIESDVVPLPNAPAGSKMNFSGNAFMVQERALKSQSEGAREYDWEKNRVWRIVNPERKHYSTGKEAGYTIDVKGGAQTLITKEDAWPRKRATFATKTVWVVKDIEGEKGGRIWPAGKYVTQTRKETEDSVSEWIRNETRIENEDILVFVTIGVTHVPRPEDWPVMPAQHVKLSFKPHNFFATNPSLDVPGKKDSRSNCLSDNGANGGEHCHQTSGV